MNSNNEKCPLICSNSLSDQSEYTVTSITVGLFASWNVIRDMKYCLFGEHLELVEDVLCLNGGLTLLSTCHHLGRFALEAADLNAFALHLLFEISELLQLAALLWQRILKQRVFFQRRFDALNTLVQLVDLLQEAGPPELNFIRLVLLSKSKSSSWFCSTYLDTVSSKLADVSIIFEARIPHSSFNLSTVELMWSWPAGAVLASTVCASSTVFWT